MSGGSYDYAYAHIGDLAQKVLDRVNQGEVTHKALRRGFGKLLARIATAAQALEWADSGDTLFEDKALPLLREIVARQDIVDAATQGAEIALADLREALALAKETGK